MLAGNKSAKISTLKVLCLYTFLSRQKGELFSILIDLIEVMVHAMHSGQKQITHMGISIMLKSQGQAIDENALYFGAK